MELINFLIFLLKVFGLTFIIGIILNLILDVVIIDPIINRKKAKKELEMFDVVIEKMKKGEDIPNLRMVEIDNAANEEKEIEK